MFYRQTHPHSWCSCISEPRAGAHVLLYAHQIFCYSAVKCLCACRTACSLRPRLRNYRFASHLQANAGLQQYCCNGQQKLCTSYADSSVKPHAQPNLGKVSPTMPVISRGFVAGFPRRMQACRQQEFAATFPPWCNCPHLSSQHRAKSL